MSSVFLWSLLLTNDRLLFPLPCSCFQWPHIVAVQQIQACLSIHRANCTIHSIGRRHIFSLSSNADAHWHMQDRCVPVWYIAWYIQWDYSSHLIPCTIQCYKWMVRMVFNAWNEKYWKEICQCCTKELWPQLRLHSLGTTLGENMSLDIYARLFVIVVMFLCNIGWLVLIPQVCCAQLLARNTSFTIIATTEGTRRVNVNTVHVWEEVFGLCDVWDSTLVCITDTTYSHIVVRSCRMQVSRSWPPPLLMCSQILLEW